MSPSSSSAPVPASSSPSASSSPKRSIVIIGDGTMGCSTAYFLTRHPEYDAARHSITLLEAVGLAAGCSGKAGGLIWFSDNSGCFGPWSSRLHEELATEHGGAERWGYQKVHHVGASAIVGDVQEQITDKDCEGQVRANGRKSKDMRNARKTPQADKNALLQKRANKEKLKALGMPEDLDWFDDGSVTEYNEWGDQTERALVHPSQYTTSLAELAQEKGLKVVIGAANSINKEDNAVKSVTYRTADGDSKTIPASDVVIAAGPWTGTLHPAPPIFAVRTHFVIIRPSRLLSAYALSSDIKLNGKCMMPAIYVRPNNEVYVSGPGEEKVVDEDGDENMVELPSSVADAEIDPKKCQEIIDYVDSISDELQDGEMLVRQVGYKPSRGGVVSSPLIGPTKVKGLFMAAGHILDGISNGPGTGKLLSEYLLDGKATISDVERFEPRNILYTSDYRKRYSNAG